MKKLWSNSRERTQGNEKRKGEDSSYPEGIAVMLRVTARKVCSDPENVDNPMIAPQDYDVRQSGRVLELQNRDHWIIIPTDLSWHFLVLATVREMPFRNYSRRSSEILKAREDKIEEAMKKTLKNIDEDWNSARWKQSSWTWTTFILIFCLARMELRQDA